MFGSEQLLGLTIVTGLFHRYISSFITGVETEIDAVKKIQGVVNDYENREKLGIVYNSYLS